MLHACIPSVSTCSHLYPPPILLSKTLTMPSLNVFPSPLSTPNLPSDQCRPHPKLTGACALGPITANVLMETHSACQRTASSTWPGLASFQNSSAELWLCRHTQKRGSGLPSAPHRHSGTKAQVQRVSTGARAHRENNAFAQVPSRSPPASQCPPCRRSI
jgi:hypothetical protein